jgi:lipoprotein-releasing system ATP-binding protein
MSDERVAELSGINKIYGDGVPTPVLFDIDLSIGPGEFVAIVGASGSGKTTLLNILGLLDTPTSGDVLIGGRHAARLTEDERAVLRRDYLGFIFQFHYLLPEFTALENALMPCRVRGRAVEEARRERVQGLMQEVGLGERLHHRPSQLSGGELQRVAIVRALANDPVLVLADEPTGNLDSRNSRAVFDLMWGLGRSTEKAFLMVTHDEGFASRADRVIHLVDGRITSG